MYELIFLGTVFVELLGVGDRNRPGFGSWLRALLKPWWTGTRHLGPHAVVVLVWAVAHLRLLFRVLTAGRTGPADWTSSLPELGMSACIMDIA